MTIRICTAQMGLKLFKNARAFWLWHRHKEKIISLHTLTVAGQRRFLTELSPLAVASSASEKQPGTKNATSSVLAN